MADRKLLHRAIIPVRWGDMDSYGHVNNSVYMQYIEEARVAWFERVGVAMNNAPLGPVVLQVQHTYLKPVVHPATVSIKLFAGALGRSSLVLEHELSTVEEPDTLFGEGSCKLVWIDHQAGHSVPVPDFLRPTFSG